MQVRIKDSCLSNIQGHEASKKEFGVPSWPTMLLALCAAFRWMTWEFDIQRGGAVQAWIWLFASKNK